MNTVNIRRATALDARLLAALNEPIHTAHFEARPDIFKPYDRSDALVNWYLEQIAQPENVLYIAEEDGEAVGCMYAKVVSRPSNPFIYETDEVLIDQISVNPAHQGKGYGKALLKMAQELARQNGIKRITLAVWAFNEHAIEFYERQGLQIYNYRMEIGVD